MRISPNEIGRLLPEQKLCTIDEAAEIINGTERTRRMGRPVVLVCGVFDVLHLGHMQFIQKASQYGTVVAGLENDEAVRANKGPTRPINSLRERMLAVASFQYVGLV